MTDMLQDRASPGGPVVISAIEGTPGIGKTALAVRWAQRVAQSFPDGQLYVNLRGFDPTGSPMKTAEAVRYFLDAFCVPSERIPLGLDAQVALYRSLLAGRKILVLLDNAKDPEHVRLLLPGSASCRTIVTSRSRLAGLVASHGARPVILGLLSSSEAMQMLTLYLGRERVASELHAANELIQLCAGLPLAISIVGARAATERNLSLRDLIGEMREQRLGTFDVGDPTTCARNVFSWSYRYLSIPAGQMFRLMGIYPGPEVSLPAAASLAGVQIDQARDALGELARVHLVEESPPGRFNCHDLLRAYARELAEDLDDKAKQRQALRRVLDHYLYTGHAAAVQLDAAREPLQLPSPQAGAVLPDIASHDEALRWFQTEHTALIAAITLADKEEFDTHSLKIPWAIADFLRRRGHWNDYVNTQRIALRTAYRHSDPAEQANCERTLGRACIWLRLYEEANTHLLAALDLHQKSGNIVGQARTHIDLGRMFLRQGNCAKALDDAQQALTLYKQATHLQGEAEALNSVGWCYAMLGNHAQGLRYCQQALKLLNKLNDTPSEADTWDSLGYVHNHLGHLQESVNCYQQALTLYRQLGYRYQQAMTLARLGDVRHSAGDDNAAREDWELALRIFTELHHPEAEQTRARISSLSSPDWTGQLDS